MHNAKTFAPGWLKDQMSSAVREVAEKSYVPQEVKTALSEAVARVVDSGILRTCDKQVSDQKKLGS